MANLLALQGDDRLRRAAIVAATAATAAAAELLKFASDGPSGDLPFGNEDPCLRLADALQLSLGIEAPFLAGLCDDGYARQHEQNGQMAASCLTFLGVEATAL